MFISYFLISGISQRCGLNRRTELLADHFGVDILPAIQRLPQTQNSITHPCYPKSRLNV